jgi:hypothetical protein
VLDQRVLATLGAARFSVDEKRLSFGVESPLIRIVIDVRLKAAGIFSDISLTGESLKVPLNQLGDFISVFVSGDTAKDLHKKLRRIKGVDDKGLASALNKFDSDTAKDATKDERKALGRF